MVKKLRIANGENNSMKMKKQILSTVLIFSIILLLFSNVVYASSSPVNQNWSGLYGTGQANSNWDSENVSNKLIWMEQDQYLEERDCIIGLTKDGLCFMTGEFSSKDLEYIKQKGLNFLGKNQVILATGVKSVEYKAGWVLLTKFDNTTLQGFGLELVKGDIIDTTVGGLVLKKDGTLWNTDSSDIKKL